MRGILISSVEEKAGKTSLILALNEIFSGYKTAYFKPFGTSPVREGEFLVDEDLKIVEENFSKSLNPIVLDMPYAEFVYSSDSVELKKAIIEAYEELDADIVFVEGSSEYKVGKSLGISDDMVAEILDLKVLVIAKYSNDFVIDRVLTAKDVFKERLRKVLINQLTGYKTSYVSAVVGKVFAENDLSVVGVLPRDPLLAGMSIEEVREAVEGEFVVKAEEGIIEHFIIGAMSKRSAEKFLAEKDNLAVITGGDRKDIQLLALNYSNVKCLILTGNLYPERDVIEKASRKGVSVIVVPEDTLTTTEQLEEAMRKAKIKGKEKIERMVELVKMHVNVDEIEKYIFD